MGESGRSTARCVAGFSVKKKILVVSHERSGTHFLINALACNFGYSVQQVDMDNSQGIDWKNGEEERAWFEAYRGGVTPRIFKSHHVYAFLEPLMPDLLDDFHVFYIERDGRDVMISFWVYLNRLAPGWGPRSATVGEFMRSKAVGGLTQYQYHDKSITMLQRWVEHLEGWNKAAPGVHRVSYEQLYSGFERQMQSIAGLLDEPLAVPKRPGMDAPSSLPWKGGVGAWKEFFNDADEHYFNSCARNGER